MDSPVLPIVSDDHMLEEAMRRLEVTGSRAVIVRHRTERATGEPRRTPDRYTMYMNRAVVEAWAAREPTCASLRGYPGEAVSVLEPSTAPAGPATDTLVEEQLDQQGTRLGLPLTPRPEDDTVLVVTRHEPVRVAIVTAVQICACSGPSRHIAEGPPAVQGGDCDTCGNPYSCV